MPRTLVRASGHTRRRALHVALFWIEQHCVHGPGDVQGMPVSHGDEYAGFILDCYTQTEAGRRIYDAAFFSRPKGCDKSGLGARLALLEALGPARFGGWAEDGDCYSCADNGCPCGWVYWYEPGEAMGKRVKVPFIRIMATEEGQPLALDTPVATPSGWTTVGALKVGDCVFGSDGTAVEVRRTTRVFDDLDCYEVTFNDGERITASGSHCWTVDKASLKDGHHSTRTVTTEQMAQDFHSKHRGNLYRIPVTPAFQLPAANLLVDPYFLGLWLGDGKTADSTIAYDARVHAEVAAQIDLVLRPGEVAVYDTGPGNQATVRIRSSSRSQLSLRARLRTIGVLGRKHIPAEYMRGSADQRLALLQGLIDSDGTVSKDKGRAGFTNADRRLIDDLEELLTTLGYKWDERYDRTVNAWRVFFQPTAEQPVARLRHKVAAHRSASPKPRSSFRHVVNVERVRSVPVKCIGIDNEDHLFAAGRHAVLTHNTGNVYDTVHFNLTDDASPLSRIDGVDAGLTRVFLPGGGEITPSTASSSSKDGGKETFVVFDETHLYNQPQLRQMHKTVTRNLRKRKKLAGTWYLETTTMFAPGDDSIAKQTYATAELIVENQAAEKKRRNLRERLLCDHRWGECDDLSAEDQLRAAILEAFGEAIDWNDIDAIVDEFYNPGSNPVDSRRYFLNSITEEADSWLAEHEIVGFSDAAKVVGRKECITLGFDGSRHRSEGVTDATALVGCRVSDGHIFTIRVWEQPDDEKDWTVPVVEVEAEVRESFTTYDVVGMYCDPAKWEQTIGTWEATYGPRLKVKATRDHPMQWWMTGGSAVKVVAALKRFNEAAVEKEITFDGSSVLTRHLRNARRRVSRSGIQIAKSSPDSPKKIDGAVAAVLAFTARMDAVAAGITQGEAEAFVPYRIR